MRFLLTRRQLYRQIAVFLIFGASYSAAAYMGFLFEVRPESISIFWPPAALLIAALCLRSVREWPALLLAASLAQIGALIGFERYNALAAVRAVTEGVAGASLLRALCGKIDMDRADHVIAVLLLPAFVVFPVFALP
jgi:integral membrane sensor domain MASE1